MIKITNGLATMTLAAGLVLGTAGAALADNDTPPVPSAPTMQSKALVNTSFAEMTPGQLSQLKGQEVYTVQGGKVGTILHLVRGERTDQMYYLVGPEGYVGDDYGTAAIPVDHLQWINKQIVLGKQYPGLALSQGMQITQPRKYAYTGDVWRPNAG